MELSEVILFKILYLIIALIVYTAKIPTSNQSNKKLRIIFTSNW